MPPFDREGALKTAEKALRPGRIDTAIAEYVRIVAAQRRDWNSANIERFRRALVMPGESDPDSIIAECLSGESPFLATNKIDLNEDTSFDQQENASPNRTGKKGSLLGRLYIEQGDTAKAVEWFERAAEAPAAIPAASRALLYDLAEARENLGEHERALAAFVELEAESCGNRDVAHRIERLSKAKAKR
jgi:tetratricopeptide (TPR) repeat protein